MAEQEDLNEKLVAASKVGNLEKVISLIKEGASMNYKDKYGMTPLHIAALGGHLDTVRFLIGSGCDPNIKSDGMGETPLHLAAEGGHLDTIRFLIDRGCDPNIKSDDYWEDTPLHMAAEEGHLDTVRFLIGSGGDPNIKTDKWGKTPYDLADDEEVKEYLLEAMSRKGKKTEEKSDVSKNEDEIEKADKELEETTENIKPHQTDEAATVEGISERPDRSKGAIPKQPRQVSEGQHVSRKTTSGHCDSKLHSIESSVSESSIEMIEQIPSSEVETQMKSKRRKIEVDLHKKS